MNDRAARPAGWYRPVKRLIDLVGALVVGIATAPLQLAVAALVATVMGRPVLFRQRRPGLHGEPFTVVKFRTMRNADPSCGLIADADRMTRLGVFLRSTSLDELPSLWNVLRGEMSLVGPRPLLVEYLERYTPEQARRHHVRPGVTGLVQVSGRNTLTWDEKFAADVRYVDECSLALDLRILARTLRAVLGRAGIAHGDEATMPEFGMPVRT